MALITADRVQETSTSTGMGAFALAGAVTGFSRFSARMSVSDTCDYVIEAVDADGVPTGEWESGVGTYSALNTLTRTMVQKSSNSDNAVSFATGTKRVYIGLTATAFAGKETAGAAAVAIAAHVAAADPHPQYLTAAEGVAAFQPLADVLTNTTASFTIAQETKLAGIATGATANSADATLLARANHTGTQAASTISDFASAADARIAAATNLRTATIAFLIDGGGSAITTGVKGDLQIPFGCTITAWSILCDQSGSIVIDIWKDTLANYPPSIADVITASAKPTVTTATNASSSTLTGWTTAITAGDTLRFNVNSATTVTRATLLLTVTKT